MAIERDVALNVIGEIADYQRELAKIPGFTQKQAARAAVQFTKESLKAQRQAARDAAKAAEQSAGAWTDAFRDAGSVIAGVLTADLLKAAATAVFDFAGELAEVRTEILRLEAATDISASTFAALGSAARVSGQEFDAIAGGIEDFGEKLFDFTRGGGAAKEAFELLGFSAEEVGERFDDTDGVLRDVFDRMVDLEDAAIRNTVQQQLFGDAGNALAAALGSVPLDTFLERAELLGTTVGPEAADATRRWNLATANLSDQLTGAAASLVDFLDVGGFLEDVSRLFFVFGAAVEEGIASSIRSVARFALAVQSLVTGDFERIPDLVQEAFDSSREGLNRVANEFLRFERINSEILRSQEELAGGAQATRRAIGALRDDLEEARKEVERLAAVAAKLASDQIAAERELAKVITEARADQLDAEEAIHAERAQTLAQIAELEEEFRRLGEEGVDVEADLAVAAQARRDVVARSLRDLEALREKEHEEELRRTEELKQAELDAAREVAEFERQQAEARRDAALLRLELSTQLFGSLRTLQTELLSREIDSVQTELSSRKRANQELLAERTRLRNEFKAADDEQTRSRIRAELDELEATRAANKERLQDARVQARKLFRAQKAAGLTAVAIETAAAIAKAFALFGPPPSPAGIASAAAAAANGVVQAALISSEKPPQFHAGFAGLFPSFTSGPDEGAATLLAGETVLNRRSSDEVGRQRIQQLNDTGSLDQLGDGGGGRAMGLFFDGRQVGEVVTRTMRRGGPLREEVARIGRTGAFGQQALFQGR